MHKEVATSETIGEVVGMDWTALGELGIGVVAIVVIFLIVKMVVSQWKNSTDAQIEATKAQLQTAHALDKNAKSYDKLAAVFEKSHEREIEFQRETMTLLKTGVITAEDTNRKVTEIHKKIV